MNRPKLLNRSRSKVVFAATGLAIALMLGSIADAEAKITAFFSAGTNCNGSPSASFVNNGAAMKVSLCVTTTTEALCGHTTKLQVGDASASGHFRVTAVVLGANYSDPNSELIFPIAITNPPAETDFGATVAVSAAAPAAKQLLMTFDISPQPSATEATYSISLAPLSAVGVRAGGACTLPTDVPIAASFKLNRRQAAEPKK